MVDVELFRLIFGPNDGYVCLAFRHREGNFREHFYKYPEEIDKLAAAAQDNQDTADVYFCPQLLEGRKRLKDSVKWCPNAWADLDECAPSNLLVPPTVIYETSPGRYQALWVFDDTLSPAEGEVISRRIAIFHKDQGCDQSGWDLTQLLRVPGTVNYKYAEPVPVTLLDQNNNRYRRSDFEEYPIVEEASTYDYPMPLEMPLISGQELLDRYNVPSLTYNLFEKKPEGDWSKALFHLEMLCFEAGMRREECFIVASESACNKYKRDKKDHRFLWQEICRGFAQNKENEHKTAPKLPAASPLLTAEELSSIENHTDFVSRYIAWGSGLGDAARQYHQASAFIILASLLSGGVVLEVNYGLIKPNLWFMLLADTTLTRKSTALNMCTNLLNEIDSQIVMATDGSVEGFVGSLSKRTVGSPTLFKRDEFSGFLEQIHKRDYLADMPTMLMSMYDGSAYKKILKKEETEVIDPTFNMYVAGIKNKITRIISEEDISSGFIPRFVCIAAEADLDAIQATGPPKPRDEKARADLLKEMRELHKFYSREPQLNPGSNGKMIVTEAPAFKARLTAEAWKRNAILEAKLNELGRRAVVPELATPWYIRLGVTALKVAVLLAAAEQRPERGSYVDVGLKHILIAGRYLTEWKRYADEILSDTGVSSAERSIMTIYGAIVRRPGVSRSTLMQNYHLTAKDASSIFETLSQRGMIDRHKIGKGETYFPILGEEDEEKEKDVQVSSST